MNIDDRTVELTQRHLDGLLSVPQCHELETLLREHAEAREAYLRELRMHAALCINLRVDRVFSASSGAEAEFSDSRQGGDKGMARTIRFKTWRWLALAASVAMVAGGVWFGLKPTGVLGLRVAEATGEVNIQHPTSNTQHPSETRAIVGMEIRQGERVVVKDGGKVGLKYDGEATTIELLAATEAGFGIEKGAKRVTLAAGKLVCAAAPQKQPFRIQTPQAVAEVVGTHFSLDVASALTTLAVQEGRVALIQDEKRLQVNAGESATAGDAGMEMVQTRGGVVWAWHQAGAPSEREPAPVKLSDGMPFSDVRAIAAGASHSLAVDSTGVVWSWGMNNNGQLGDGTTTDRPNPARVRTADGNPLSGVTAVAVGQLHSVALKSDHTVWAWGSGFECGSATARQLLYPVRVAGVSDVVAIAACATHTLALKADRTVLEWGAFPTIQNRVPALVRQRDGGTLSDIIAISAGANHSVALKKDGSVWTWGVNMYGALGDGGKTSAGSMAAVQVRVSDGSALSNVVAVAGGRDRTVALTSDNSIWVWGRFGRGSNSALNSAVQLLPAPGVPPVVISAIVECMNPHDILVLTRAGVCLGLTIAATDMADEGVSALRYTAERIGAAPGVSAISTQFGSCLVVARGEGR